MNEYPESSVTLADIEAARTRIGSAVPVTPCRRSHRLSRHCGFEVLLKLENLQFTGSFKERGALNKLLQLSAEQRAAGVIAASAGNHAQAVAHTARTLGVRATIVMPETAPLTKIRGTQAFGAEVVLYGASYASAFERARAIEKDRDMTFIHAFDDAAVIAGQGTIGLELLEQVPGLDAVVVPVGGGGLIAGIAAAIKATRPEVRIVGVQTERMPAMRESLAAGHITPLRSTNTIADGISIAHVGKHTFPLVQRYVDEVRVVSEDAIASAVMHLLEGDKTLAEGAGAVGVAALYDGQIALPSGARVAVVVSGGNIDMTRLSVLIERGLESEARIVHLEVVVPDTPGSIAALAAAVAEQRANILQIYQTRHIGEVELGEIEVTLSLETKGHTHVGEIVEAIRAKNFRIL